MMLNKLLVVILFSLMAIGCGQNSTKDPIEPHLELGQKITFPGSDPLKAYIIIGYKKTMESHVQDEWLGQEYIVFLYPTDNGEYKTATIHINAITKN